MGIVYFCTENCKRNSTELRDIFKARYVNLQNMIKPLMRDADRYAWTCDPDVIGPDVYGKPDQACNFLKNIST